MKVQKAVLGVACLTETDIKNGCLPHAPSNLLFVYFDKNSLSNLGDHLFGCLESQGVPGIYLPSAGVKVLRFGFPSHQSVGDQK